MQNLFMINMLVRLWLGNYGGNARQCTGDKVTGSSVLNNWLLNSTGHPNSWVEIDLMQENLNY